MNKMNQKAFTVVEVALVAIALGVFGFGGYYIFSQNDDETTKESDTPAETTDSTQEEESPNDESTPDDTTDDTADEAKLVENSTSKFDISLPEGWDVAERGDFAIDLKSADFKAPTGNDTYIEVGEGIWIEVTYEESDGDVDTLMKGLENNITNLGMSGSYEEMKVDGNRAVYSTVRNGGSNQVVTTYVDGTSYSFILKAVVDEEELFRNILETVKFK